MSKGLQIILTFKRSAQNQKTLKSFKIALNSADLMLFYVGLVML